MKHLPQATMNRREFIITSGMAVAGITSGCAPSEGPEGSSRIAIILDSGDATAASPPSLWAVNRLEEALEKKGIRTIRLARVEEASNDQFCIQISGCTSSRVEDSFKKTTLAVPEKPESLGLIQDTVAGRPVLFAAGRDVRGLVYAVMELTDRVLYAEKAEEALTLAKPVIEQPANRIRSIYRCFVSEIEDKPWFYDREMWKHYLTMLATQRFNRFSLTLGMGYNTPNRIRDSYLFFAYPFLLNVPGYQIRAVGLPDEERDRNLDMLKYISDETVARGIDFQLALWSHGRDWPNSENVNYPVEGLTAENHGPYCRDALAAVLSACPSISGTTFRVHSESGVPHGTEDFWKVLFEAHEMCGRQVEIDMHGKQITQKQIDYALATGMPVNVSPKYWGEQMGLPYHQADIRKREKANEAFEEPPVGVGLQSRSFTRYGYGDLIPEDRQWGILHRIWPGTQHLLLSGDPVMDAGYGRVSSFCDSMGVERLDPLNFKGRMGSGHPGGRCAYADKSLEPKYDWEKFLYTYRIWGRLVYNPDSDPDVWRRYLRKTFQSAADPMEQAMAAASRVLLLITTAHGPSANCMRYWPEVYTNQPIVDPDRNVPYSDTPAPKSFGNVSSFDPQLFSGINEYTDATLSGKKLQKYSPIEVALWLDELSKTALENLRKTEDKIPDPDAVDYRRFYADIEIQAAIARFFAGKMRSAALWRIHETRDSSAALTAAIAEYQTARDAWAAMAKKAQSIYVEDISFGNHPNLMGHWIDRIPAMDGDIGDMKEALKQAKKQGSPSNDSAAVKHAITQIQGRPMRTYPVCRHEPVEEFQPGRKVTINLIVQDKETKEVTLYYRRANQAVNWQKKTMNRTGNQFSAEIPAAYTQTRYPLLYYTVIELEDKEQAIYPGLNKDLTGMPYLIVRNSIRTI